MCLRNRILIIVVVFLLAGCGSSKMITSYQTNAENAEASGDFETATENWQLYLENEWKKGVDVPVESIARAAKTAFKAKQFDLGINLVRSCEICQVF